jgi:hypothetical protein
MPQDARMAMLLVLLVTFPVAMDSGSVMSRLHARLRHLRPHETDQGGNSRSQSGRRRRNFADCKNGYSTCEHGKLTQAEASEVVVAQNQRNLSDCRRGVWNVRPVQVDA